MSEQIDIRTQDVKLDAIQIGDRLRPVSPQAVEALVASIDQNGLIQAIQLREADDGTLMLIAGAHRLEAHRRLGRETIMANIHRCSEDRARLIEVEENLLTSELTMLDLALHLQAQRRLYQELNPHLRHGGDRKSEAFSADQTKTNLLLNDVAERRGISAQHMRALARIGKNLTRATISELRLFKRPPVYRLLADLACIHEPEIQARTAAILVDGSAKRVCDAERLARGQAPVTPPSEHDKRLDALRRAWLKAPEEARQEFLQLLIQDHADDLEAAAEAVRQEGDFD